MTAVRLATTDDVPLLLRHRRCMFEDMAKYVREQIDVHDGVYEPWAREGLQAAWLIGFIAEHQGCVAASACLWLRPRQPSPGPGGPTMPYLLSMFTERDCRRQGHAEAIVRAALAWAVEHGFPTVNLHASDMGRGLYEKLGFARTWEMEIALPPAATPSSLKDSR